MNLHILSSRMKAKGIFFSEESLAGRQTVIGYEKQFRWLWLATQLNTFVVAADYGDETVTVQAIEELLDEAFAYSTANYTGWPRGLQSGLATIAMPFSSRISDEAIAYCRESKAGKKWAGFAVPVTINTVSQEVFLFDRNPIWGQIYYPYIREVIEELTS